MDISKVIQEQVKKINPEKEVIDSISEKVREFIKKLEMEIKRSKLKAEVFIGGSFAKGTVIKKDKYEVDLNLRFDKKDPDKMSELSEEIIKKITKNYIRLHGSRDYFQVLLEKNIILEVIPVLKISKPKDADNITDLSYLHVNYVKKHLKKSKKLADEIKIAKAFTHAQKCYGAESYIKGFSGYALELLVIHYGGFLKFLKDIVKSKQQIIIFDKKMYKNKQELMMNINDSKTKSPIVLIDPTFKERNALAALSEETYEKFKHSAQLFLKSPSEKYFQLKNIDFSGLGEKAKKKKNDFIIVELDTNKQEGDIAGSKMIKFYNFILKEIDKYFVVKNSEFEYNLGGNGKFYLNALRRKEVIIRGPPKDKSQAVVLFKKSHKNTFMKGRIIYAKEKIDFNLHQFLQKWRDKNETKMNEMYIIQMKIFD